jgi:hypothetical protein
MALRRTELPQDERSTAKVGQGIGRRAKAAPGADTDARPLSDMPTQEQYRSGLMWGVPEEEVIEEPGQPCAIPARWLPIATECGRMLGVRVELYRQIGCPRESACLTVAVKRGWPGFGCARCEHATRPYLNPHRARGY